MQLIKINYDLSDNFDSQFEVGDLIFGKENEFFFIFDKKIYKNKPILFSIAYYNDGYVNHFNCAIARNKNSGFNIAFIVKRESIILYGNPKRKFLVKLNGTI